jgi:hypothetical protein
LIFIGIPIRPGSDGMVTPKEYRDRVQGERSVISLPLAETAAPGGRTPVPPRVEANGTTRDGDVRRNTEERNDRQ